jgi:cell division protein FtsI/penicillin-binding protein 2
MACSVPCVAQPSDNRANLEQVISKLMAGRTGAVVVLEVDSGKILARSNLKIAAQRVTAPGSVVKPFVLLELLRLGKLDPSQHLVCHRKLTLAGKRMDCTHAAAITNLNATDAIAYSCNSYFAQAATRLSPDELVRAFQQAGFTARTGLAPGEDEVAGRIIPAPDLSHLQLQALGDWGVEVTPLELLGAYRKLALHRFNNDLPLASPVFDGLEASVQYGMAHTDNGPSGITAAGKTGTAAEKSTPQTHGFFVGYAPADRPEIVLMVYLEHGHGSDAAEIAAPIFTAYQKERAARR